MKTLPQLRTEAILTRQKVVNMLDDNGYTEPTEGVALVDLIDELGNYIPATSGEAPVVIDSAYDYYENYTGNEIVISMFISPTTTFYGNEQDALTTLQSMYDCGINYPLIDHGFEYFSGEIVGLGQMGYMLDAAEKLGKKILVNSHHAMFLDTAEHIAIYEPLIRDIIDNSYQHPACAGWYVGDEPKANTWANIYALQQDYRENVFDPDRTYNMTNMLLPSYGMYQEASYISGEKFGEYLEDFQVAFGGVPDYVTTNHYIWINGWNQTAGVDSPLDMRNHYISEMACIRAVRGNNKSMTVIQIANIWQTRNDRAPVLEMYQISTEHIRFSAHVALAFGVSSIWGYVYHSTNYPGGSSYYFNTDSGEWTIGLIGYAEACMDYYGRRTKVYDMCKEVFTGIHKMKGVQLDYNQTGFIEHDVSLPSKFDRNTTAYGRWSGEFPNYGYMQDLRRTLPIGGVSSIFCSGETVAHPMLSGFFTKDGGDTGFYAVNLDSEPQTANTNYPEYTFNLDGVKNFRVWSSEGLIQMASGETIKIGLAPGEGQFIEIVGGCPVDPDTSNKVKNSTFEGGSSAEWTFSGSDFTTTYRFLTLLAKTHTLSPVSQEITGLVAGARYKLSYDFITGLNGIASNVFVRCSVGSANLMTYHHNVEENTTYTDYFIAPDTTCTLQFLFSNTGANPSYIGIDNISIIAA